MRYAQIRNMDISNGPGIGVSLFTQGCPLRCDGCHNASIWDFNGGEEFTSETKNQILKLMESEHISRFSVLGGESTAQDNIIYLSNLFSGIKEKYPNKQIWMWSGYTWEELQKRFEEEDTYLLPYWEVLLMNLDVLVDGPFIQSQKDLTLKWRGSSNQRVINVPETLRQNKIVLLSEDE